MIRFYSLILGCLALASTLSAEEVNPTASFAFSGTQCVDNTIEFINNSTPLADPIVINIWEFGDGGSSTATNPSHTYATAGTYTVRLTVQDESGDVDVTSQMITIDPLPQVGFSFSAANQCISTTQTFSNTSVIPSNDLTYSWNFGDGNTSTLEDPTHDYGMTGTFEVTLIATSTSTTCSSTTSDFITIYPDPVAGFNFENQCDGNALSFENSSSVSSGNLTYAWTFGDGNSSSLQNPSNLYASAGTYSVQLTVTTENGCSDVVTEMVTVYDQSDASFTASNVCLEEEVDFTNTSTLATSYNWDFDDGSTSTDESPTHTYEFPGIYEVVLVTSNAAGCSDEFTRFIEISPLPTASFNAEDVCLGQSMSFENESVISTGDLTYSWDFGDGGSSAATAPSHSYIATGSYMVELTVNSENGCSDSFTTSVEVFATSVGGSLAGSTTRCEDDDATYQLTLSGHTGAILRWESSNTGTDQWVTIENSTTTLDYSDLANTMFYRAVVQNQTCDPVFSSVAEITIDELAVGGTLSGTTTTCSGDNSGKIQLSGEEGTIEEWLFSTDSEAGPWTTINSTSDFQDYADLTETTHYRVVLASGVCENDTSSVATVTIDENTVAGVLSSSATVCTGDNTGTLGLSGFMGSIVKWESAQNGNGPWSSIDVQESTLDFNDLTFSTYYRVRVQNGTCQELISNQVLITVDETTIAGSITGTTAICSEESTVALTIEGFRGAILRWQSSADQTTWDDIANTTTGLSVPNLTDTTYYRVEIQNGVCASVFTETFRVSVNAIPEASFTADEVCTGTTTTFANASTIAGSQSLTYSWDFSDGGSSTLENPAHSFASAGSYNVKLIVTSSAGCIDSVTHVVIVNENPVVDFTQINVCLGEEMTFINQSTPDESSVASYSWDFGDGTTSDVKDPEHTYETMGTFEVTLSIETNDGCSGEITKSVAVNPLPAVDFSFTDVCDGQEVNFVNNSTVSDGNISYSWSFGDGISATAQNPSHTYENEGSYLVNLRVQTEGGCSRDLTKTITIFNQPTASFTVEDECLDSLVSFVNTSIGVGLTYEWTFGDGATSTLANPTHQYSVSGLYNVMLRVQNENDCSDSFLETVQIHALPVVNFVAANVCDTVTASFSNLSSISAGGLSYEWDFGDANTSTAISPRHLYGSSGTFDVELTATSNQGCVTTFTKPITIYPRPQSSFTFEEVCDGVVTSFENTSTLASGRITSYLWEFGDETSSVVENASKQFLNEGTYEISLLITSEFGCQSKSAQEAQVFELPVANFEVENVCVGFNVNPVNRSTIDDGSLSYLWDFGDETSATIANPSHGYAAPGVYTITLTASSPNGCTDVIQKDVLVYAAPIVGINNDTTVSQGFPAQLFASGGTSYVWSPTESLDNSNIANPIATPLEETTYEVLVTDQFGCQNTNSVTVSVTEDFKLIANNVFTPDGNGQNDFWVIDNVETFGTVNVRVYDRFGKLVFQDEAYQNDWTGTTGNDILPDGTYYYLITFSDSPTKYSGAITLIRNR